VGFEPANGHRHPRDGHQFGLEAMSQRLRRVGGDLQIESSPGSGTAVSARVPAIPTEAGR
jgi:signal transduction histidine kinase